MKDIRLFVYTPTGDRFDFGNATYSLLIKSVEFISGIGARRVIEIVTPDNIKMYIGLGEGWTYVVSTKES